MDERESGFSTSSSIASTFPFLFVVVGFAVGRFDGGVVSLGPVPSFNSFLGFVLRYCRDGLSGSSNGRIGAASLLSSAMRLGSFSFISLAASFI
jgi:hypothetical protein